MKTGTTKEKIFRAFFAAVVSVFLCFPIITFSPSPACALEVEIETGPEFEPGDRSMIEICVFSKLKSRFPWDFLYTPLPTNIGTACPGLTLWDWHFEFCWLIEVWNIARPGFTIAMFWSAITRL